MSADSPNFDPLPKTASPLTDEERARYTWQMWTEGFGEVAQEKLKSASVLVSRCGGVGGQVAYQLAAAGVGRLILAHAGELRLNDLNRQILMSTEGIGVSRVEQAAARLRAFNPHVEIIAVPENITPENAATLIRQVDVVASCAPLFQERLWMNQAAVAHGKPLVDCAMYEWDVQLLTIKPGRTACLACLYPEVPTYWRREFPVLGGVAATAGALGAVEILKLITGIGESLAGTMLLGDLGAMTFRRVRLGKRPGCPVCPTNPNPPTE